MQESQSREPLAPYVALGMTFVILVLVAIFGNTFTHVVCPIVAALVVGIGVWVHRAHKAFEAEAEEPNKDQVGWSAYGDGTDF